MESNELLHKIICICLRKNIVPLCCVAKCFFGNLICTKGNRMVHQYFCKESIVFKDFRVSHHLLDFYKLATIGFTIVLILQHLSTAVDNKFFMTRLDDFYKRFIGFELFVQIVNQFKTLCMRI